MSQGNFKIYRSSAGSGKTYTLTREYLKLALHKPDYFKHILAVTFTNKATEEMKNRIIGTLYDFSLGGSGDLAEELKQSLDLTDKVFIQRSKDVLSNILHNYSHFAVSTIDAFFQNVVRAFSKEIGLHGAFTLELEQDKVLAEVIDKLLSELGKHKTLTQWLSRFAQEKVDEAKSWDVRNDIKSLAFELFTEEFKSFESEIAALSEQRDFFRTFLKEVQKLISIFESEMARIGKQALLAMGNHGLEISDFSYGKTGVANYFQKIIEGKDVEPGKRVLGSLDNIESWYSKSSKKKDLIEQAVENDLIHLLNQAVDYYDQNHSQYYSALKVVRYVYVVGILSDLTNKLRAYKAENDVMLISDAALFLKEIIDGNDTPFIYEKVGSFYNHYLIDEFQDTSGFQWTNFKPLIQNSLAEGYTNLVVGDVKQSIYRWRGGDWRLLLEQIEADTGPAYVKNEVLDTNYRSTQNVIMFNNELFLNASQVLAQKCIDQLDALPDADSNANLKAQAEQIGIAYQDVVQNISPSKLNTAKNGFVEVKFYQNSTKDDGESLSWKDHVNEYLPKLVEKLQDQQIPLKDVAVLVRNARDGKAVADLLLAYANSDSAESKYRYDVISNESLFLQSSPLVLLLINALKYIVDANNSLVLVNIAHEYQKYVLGKDVEQNAIFSSISTDSINQFLPEEFVKKTRILSVIPLFEVVESLIRTFSISNVHGAYAYIQAFQDLVLEFTKNDKGDIASFLSWWEENKHKKAIQVSEDLDAIRILTIHKSKGLQFKAVVVPYCDWIIDHDTRQNNIVWCQSDQRPFSKVPYLPFRYEKGLVNTIYQKAYFEEMIKAYLDNLNLLYVAFTRAEDSLFIFGQQPTEKKDGSFDLKRVSDLLYAQFQSNEVFSEHWGDETLTYQTGQLENGELEKGSEIAADELTAYPSTNWRKKLSIKRYGKGYFDADEKNSLQKINYGLLVHDILARMKSKEHLEPALNEMLYEGLIDEQDKEKLYAKISMLFENETVNDWFTTDWDVKTEVPILPDTGELSRLDRVMTQDDNAIIVDFKTGETKDAGHHRQVERYKQLLKGMGYSSVEGYLLYMDDIKVEKVG